MGGICGEAFLGQTTTLVNLIVCAVKQLGYHEGVGILIVTEWPSASFVREFLVISRQIIYSLKTLAREWRIAAGNLPFSLDVRRLIRWLYPLIFADLLRYGQTLSLVLICSFFFFF